MDNNSLKTDFVDTSQGGEGGSPPPLPPPPLSHYPSAHERTVTPS